MTKKINNRINQNNKSDFIFSSQYNSSSQASSKNSLYGTLNSTSL